MKALVTGGAGFIGSHLVDLLVAEGHDVAVVDNLVTGKLRNLNPAARFHEIDIVNPALEDIFREESPDVVFHEAAQASVKASTDDPRYDAQVNVIGLLNVLEACVAARVKKVVFASSGATYGNPERLPMDEEHPQRPESPYGITKFMAEHYLRYYQLDRGLGFTALRYGNVYGPRQDSLGEAGVVSIFIRQLLTEQVPVIHWDGEQVRDYVYVGDVARANLLAATAGDGRCYCIGTGIGTSVNELYRVLCDETGVNVSPRHGPRRAGDLRAARFETKLARAEIGWEPVTSLRDGIRATVEACRDDLDAQVVPTPIRPRVQEVAAWP
ncbi:MAG: UDP-glucose 4-epimerase [Chloroflexota bacterium]|jgi:UDP-glucose 4-epimerase|nr:UDP-glucose 4-epimerase [Chloroflexota bacterium]